MVLSLSGNVGKRAGQSHSCQEGIAKSHADCNALLAAVGLHSRHPKQEEHRAVFLQSFSCTVRCDTFLVCVVVLSQAQ